MSFMYFKEVDFSIDFFFLYIRIKSLTTYSKNKSWIYKYHVDKWHAFEDRVIQPFTVLMLCVEVIVVSL